MKKQIIVGIAITASVALCAAVWPRNNVVRDLPAEPINAAIIAEIETAPEESPQIIPSTSGSEVAAESELLKTGVITAEEKNEPMPSAEPVSEAASTPSAAPKPSAQPSSNPKPGDRTIIGGKPHVWIPGFGWIEDKGGGSTGIFVDGEGDINKQVGVMGGGTAVGNPGDELTGNKVGIMGADDKLSPNTNPVPGTKKNIHGKPHVWVPGFGWVEDEGGGSTETVAGDMYENGHKIGIMGGSESPPRESAPPVSAQPEPTGNVIYIELVPTPTKNSTPPPYRPDTTSP